MAAMEELEALLQSLQALKPPGVTKPKIDAITAKCVENVQSDIAIVHKIVQQFRNSPNTHKLGVIYVLDSVTRQWLEKARVAGQAVSRNAASGTYASGVQRVTEVLPTLMTALVQCAPDSQKEKISKLLDIWERGQTFPLDMLAGFKQQISAPQKNTYTPPGSPPKGLASTQAFNGMTNQQNVAPPPPTAAPLQDTGALLAALAGLGQQTVQANPVQAAPPALPYLQNAAPPLPGFLPPPPAVANGQPAAPPPALGGVPPGAINEVAAQIIQAMQAGTISPDQGLQFLSALSSAMNGAGAAPSPMQQQQQQPSSVPPAQPAAHDPTPPARYEQNGSRYRDRSRSPDLNRRRRSPDRRSPVNRRDSPTYGVYDPNAAAEGTVPTRPERGERGGRNRGRNRGNRAERNEYRQRSPPGQRGQPSPSGNGPRNQQQKFLEWDHTLPRDNIKVLSRTLFVGGAGGTEAEIRNIFSRFGKVQTCIVNQDKRHAFVKMVDRHDAVAAKEGMDNIQDPAALSKARQTRWGVGFGPRDCSDYNTGISVIPISRLTDADRKWVLTAEYGGTGGRALEGGMVIEEPDIEIGAGVSSKAISRRVPLDPPRSGRGGGFKGRNAPENRGGSHKQDRPAAPEQRHISPRPEPAVAVPPAVPGFGFQLPGF
ncbi:hypothetical protein BS50DRAFT_358644 [Corynespora cassiicola Philippines]|uniref:RNA binding protein Nrd1 n=1 Tax=Corynespora cassiicola Philippines TaxID=1448308 RepID=A0A2T2NSA3_CORCC|nr:hypothetical protein BS50DRAFT_358644 [Corynespora cassiicola Philippines]